MKGTLHYSVADQIARLRFGSPAGNALPAELLQQITAQIDAFGADDSARILLLESQGNGAFCGGAYLNELMEVRDPEAGKDFFMGFARLINALRKCPKFVIGRIHGKIVGGGVGLAAACDFALATRAASVKLSELSIGLGPYVIEPAVSRKIGTPAFAQLSFEATRWKDAQWGLDKGLYAQLYPDIEALDDALHSQATQWAQYDPKAMAALKKLHWKDTDHWDELLPKNAAITGELACSDFTQNFLKKLKNK